MNRRTDTKRLPCVAPPLRGHIVLALLLLFPLLTVANSAGIEAALARAKAKGVAPARAMEILDSALVDAAASGDPRNPAMVQFQRGRFLYRLGQYGESYAAYQAAGHSYAEAGDELRVARSWRHVGIVLQAMGDLDRAREYFEKAQPVCLRLGARMETAKLHSHLGVLAAREEDHPKAMALFSAAYEEKIKLKDTLAAADDLANISILYSRMGLWDEAREKQFAVINIYEQYHKLEKHSNCYNDLGALYFRQNRLDSAEYYFLRALESGKTHSNMSSVTCAIDNLTSLALAANRPDSALALLERSYEFTALENDSTVMATRLLQAAHIYRQKSMPDMAVDYAQRALSIAHSIGMLQTSKGCYQLLSEIHEAEGRNAEALAAYREFTMYKDSILNKDALVKFSNLRVQLETTEARHEIESLRTREAKAEIKRFYMSLAILGLLLAGILGVIVVRLRYLQNRSAALAHEKLLKERLKIGELENRQLQSEVEWKEKELANHTLNLLQTNALLSEIEQALLKGMQKGSENGAWQPVLTLVRSRKRRAKDWENFQKYFGTAHVNFFEKIKKAYPNLSPNELRLCALVHLNLNLRETAEILGISPSSVKVARYRLKKKLELPEEMSLHAYIQQM